MKFQIISKEELKWLIPLIGVVTLYFVGNNIYSHFKVNDISVEEKHELVNFVKEHNNSLKFKIEKESALGEDVSKISFGVDENQSEEESEILKPLIVEEKNPPYTEKLPEMPDEEENNSTLFGVDSNENGVRDDLEIMIVQEYGDDKYMTELSLARERSHEYEMSLTKQENTTKEELQGVVDDISMVIECTDSVKYDYHSTKPFDIKLWNKRMSDLRKKGRSKLWFGGMGKTDIDNPTRQECLDFIQKTKDKYSNFR